MKTSDAGSEDFGGRICQVCKATNAKGCAAPNDPGCYLSLPTPGGGTLEDRLAEGIAGVAPGVKPKRIELGKLYRDESCGYVGTAVAHHKYLYGGDRITLRALHGGRPNDWTTDARALKPVDEKQHGAKPGVSKVADTGNTG